MTNWRNLDKTTLWQTLVKLLKDKENYQSDLRKREGKEGWLAKRLLTLVYKLDYLNSIPGTYRVGK